MVSFNIETIISGANLSLWKSFIKIGVTVYTLENLLKIAVLNRRLNKADMERVG